MKKIQTVFVLIVSAATAWPQTVITFENHALKNGEDNPMSYCEYAEPGSAGSDISWDFSDLAFKKSFTGFLADPAQTELGQGFENANTELAEFGSRFYFHVDESNILQYGYSSSDGRSQIKYNAPFIKMKYPFSFGQVYSGSFNGNYLYNGIQTGAINGSYSVEADAYGTLTLPGNSVFENTLRVRSEKTYTTTFSNSTQEVSVVTYRWYNQYHRYPLLVLTEYTTRTGDHVSTNYQAAFNNKAVTSLTTPMITGSSLYPNPVTTSLMLDFNATAAGKFSVSILDAAGKIVHSFNTEITQSGQTQLDLSSEIQGLQPGAYTVIATGEGLQLRNSFTKVK